MGLAVVVDKLTLVVIDFPTEVLDASDTAGDLDGDLTRVFPPLCDREIFPSCCLAADVVLSGFCDIINLRTFWT